MRELCVHFLSNPRNRFHIFVRIHTSPPPQKRKETLNWLPWDFYVSEECSTESKLYAIPDGRNAYFLTTKTIVWKLQCLIRVPTLKPAANIFIFTGHCVFGLLLCMWAFLKQIVFYSNSFLTIFSLISFSSFLPSYQKSLTQFLVPQFRNWLFKRFYSA